ncbi:MAG: Uma2 family endonuclease [Chloroflexota bacterium]
MALEQVPRRRFTATEFEQMAWAGILREDDRVELVDGEIRQMSPIGDRHYACVLRLSDLFWQHLGRTALVSVQNPVRLDPFDEPQPDVALLHRGPGYPRTKATPSEILLVAEVADTSLEYDQGEKVSLYARAGVREVWVIDLINDVVIGYHTPQPSAGQYLVVARRARGQTLAPQFAPDQTFSVADILG